MGEMSGGLSAQPFAQHFSEVDKILLCRHTKVSHMATDTLP